MKVQAWTLSVENLAPASAAFLGENPRLEKMFLHTGVLRVLGDVSREGRWGSDGVCLYSWHRSRRKVSALDRTEKASQTTPGVVRPDGGLQRCRVGLQTA